MPDPITRLNAALEGRYRIERELGGGHTDRGRIFLSRGGRQGLDEGRVGLKNRYDPNNLFRLNQNIKPTV